MRGVTLSRCSLGRGDKWNETRTTGGETRARTPGEISRGRCRCVARCRKFHDDRIEFALQFGADRGLVGHLLRWFVPWPPRCHAAFERMRDQLPHLLALQRHELLVRIVAIELRAEVDRVDARVVAINDQEVLRA